MNIRSDRSVVKRLVRGQGEARAAKTRVQGTEWERTD
jgi:hypothetical protein